jgi:radical SAM superfamily enzyme YgiQ (UPF0313 family)
MYSPLQFAPGETAKPDGSLSLAYLAGALRDAGYDVSILDCAVGDDRDSLTETFFRPVLQPNGLMRIGMSPESILERVDAFDIIGVSSVFTTQSRMALDLIGLIRNAYPEKLIIAGGVNSRSLRSRFFDAGADIIALSEAEGTVVQIADALRGKGELLGIRGIAYRDETGCEVVNPASLPVQDLDDLPLPAWDLMPLQKYWRISRPHGGQYPPGKRIAYASLQTSRGCPFECPYCHISKETAGSASGEIGRFRVKSIDRVLQELDILEGLGVEEVFFEDDSLFANKKRAYRLFELVREMRLNLMDVNGVNICHLLKNGGHRLVIDVEFIEVLAAAGFKYLALPFESASQRILNVYASSKWKIDRTDTREMIRAFNSVNMQVSGNYMMGFPDETLSEIHATIEMARRHMEEGLHHALFFAVVPFPGTRLFDMVIRNGQLSPDFDTDQMRWQKSILKGLAVSSDTLEEIRQTAWLTVNRPDYVRHKREEVVGHTPMFLATPT